MNPELLVSHLEKPSLDYGQVPSWGGCVRQTWLRPNGTRSQVRSRLSRLADPFQLTLTLLGTLSPEYDEYEVTGLLRDGGRLQLKIWKRMPIILDSAHPITKLLIQDSDQKLLHREAASRAAMPVLVPVGEGGHTETSAQLQRRPALICKVWHFQGGWSPAIQAASLQAVILRKSTVSAVTVKIGHRNEKRWGILYKCMTTRCTPWSLTV